MPPNQQVLGVLNEVFIHLYHRVTDLFCAKLLTKMKSCTFYYIGYNELPIRYLFSAINSRTLFFARNRVREKALRMRMHTPSMILDLNLVPRLLRNTAWEQVV